MTAGAGWLRDLWEKEKIRLARILYASMAAQVYMNLMPGAACNSPSRLMTDRVSHGSISKQVGRILTVSG
jgi:hypothetical protein